MQASVSYGYHGLRAIYEISKTLGSSLDFARSIRDVLGILTTQLEMQRCMIYLVQESGDVHVIGASGLTSDEIERGRFQKGEGIIGKIITSGKSLIIPDIAKEPLFLNKTGSRSLASGHPIAFLGIPIQVEGETIGAMSVDLEMTRYQGNLNEDVDFLEMVGDLISQHLALHQKVANERATLMHVQHRLQKEARPADGMANIIGESPIMQEVFADVERAAGVSSTVLIRGESGTGKELIAQAIHQLSSRRHGPFIRVNCAALSETLLESELFGHEKGSFTGATSERKGRFELADGGTLFLDEIGDVSPAFQVKLLRVLQEGEFERVGGTKPIKVDVRLVAATNKNLEEAVANNEFRADLYFRINVISIILPALRNRSEDIPELVRHFLERFNDENQRDISMSQEAMNILIDCYWPGNVRELENCVERTAAMTSGKVIQDINLPCQKNLCFSIALRPISQMTSPVPKLSGNPLKKELQPTLDDEDDGFSDEMEGVPQFASKREKLVWAMEQSGWVQAKAARLLSMTTRQVHYALKKYNIEIKKF